MATFFSPIYRSKHFQTQHFPGPTSISLQTMLPKLSCTFLILAGGSLFVISGLFGLSFTTLIFGCVLVILTLGGLTHEVDSRDSNNGPPVPIIRIPSGNPSELRRRLKIILIQNEEECRAACLRLRQDLKFSVLGFDCEWVTLRTGERRPVALLQLASVEGLCCLFRLNRMHQLPFELREILEDINILKVGVDPLNDAKLLLQDYNSRVAGTLDLRCLYETKRGLLYLAQTVLGVSLDKSTHLQCSNWEALILTYEQQNYAAKDAFVSVEIFREWALENNFITYGKLSRSAMVQLFRVIDRKPGVVNIAHSSDKLDEKVVKPEGLIKHQLNKVKHNFVTRKVPLYDNCFMLAPDGELLCSCDKKKAQWYLDKSLAELLPGEPCSIKLLFEPAGRAGNTSGGRYYQQLKQNCCVVCGVAHSYLRHNVVPKEYRKHFPKSMKDHQSHDIVLMCLNCHFEASKHNDVLKQKLAVICDAPIKTEPIQDKEVQKIKNCATALLNSGDTIPSNRKMELENKIKEFHNVAEVTTELLLETAALNPKPKKDCYTHGSKVVNCYKDGSWGGLEELQRLWRAHFIHTMNPKYLPALWSVTHNSTMARMAHADKKLDLTATD